MDFPSQQTPINRGVPTRHDDESLSLSIMSPTVMVDPVQQSALSTVNPKNLRRNFHCEVSEVTIIMDEQTAFVPF